MTAIVGAGRQYTVGTAGGCYLEKEGGRGFLAIQNDGTADVLVGMGSLPSGTAGRKIVSGTTWEPQNVPGDAIWMKTASGTATVTVFSGSPNR